MAELPEYGQMAPNGQNHGDEGILYIATGSRFILEAAENAREGRKHAGGRKIALVTDGIREAEMTGSFDLVLPHPDPRHDYRDKIPPLAGLPFAKTLFLDTDARLVSSVEGLFKMLDRYDFAAAHAPVRIPDGWEDRSVPRTFPEFNSGVLMLRRSPVQEALIDLWLKRYDEVGQAWDQATLRSAAWEMTGRGLHHAVLPPEANLRTTKPWVAGPGLEVMIVHGRVPQDEWKPFVNYLNSDIQRFRTWENWMRKNPGSEIRLKLPDRSGHYSWQGRLKQVRNAAGRLRHAIRQSVTRIFH